MHVYFLAYSGQSSASYKNMESPPVTKSSPVSVFKDPRICLRMIDQQYQNQSFSGQPILVE
eukprot:m.48634 g.48634  ORF g.48634 m.48634 type:complete len:61 (+) comp10575_c0_seq2:2480-2662(+)